MLVYQRVYTATFLILFGQIKPMLLIAKDFPPWILRHADLTTTRAQEWVEQPVHKEIGEAVAQIYRESRAEGGAFCLLLSQMKDGEILMWLEQE